MRYIPLFFVLYSYADFDLNLINFSKNRDIYAHEYNENINKIYNELQIREYDFLVTPVASGGFIDKDLIEKQINDILNLKSIQPFSFNSNEISSDSFNFIFNKLEGHVNNEFKTKECSVLNSTGVCSKAWDDFSRSYIWDYSCNPNYQSSSDNLCNKFPAVNFSVAGNAGWQNLITLKTGQAVYLNCHSGYVKLGKNGGYYCSNNSSAYSSSYRLTNSCTGGSPVFRVYQNGSPITGYLCGRNVNYVNNNDGDVSLYFIINDSERGNNSGSVNFTVTYLDQP